MEHTPEALILHTDALLADGDAQAIAAAMEDISWKAMQLIEAGEEGVLEVLDAQALRLTTWMHQHGL